MSAQNHQNSDIQSYNSNGMSNNSSSGSSNSRQVVDISNNNSPRVIFITPPSAAHQ
jgi:hypothetical protein